MNKKPEILQSKIIATSRLFRIEQMHLRFSNGEERMYERLLGRSHGAVMIIPMLNDDEVLLIREYAAGTHRYELGLPKGLIEKDENLYEAANRELQEEVGYGAKSMSIISEMSAAPGYFGSTMTLLLAQDLYPSQLEGDEPEAIEVVPWRLSELPALLERDDFSEARSIAALFIMRERCYGA